MKNNFKKKLNKLKVNNTGSTLVLAMLAVVFISVIATLVLSSAVMNITMKRIDYNSKNTFYTAESVLEEVKAGVGKDGMMALGDSYEKVLTNLVKDDATLSYMMDNEEANLQFKNNFMKNMVNKVTKGAVNFEEVLTFKEDSNPVTIANVKEYLSQYILNENKKYAVIESISSITIVREYNGLEYKMILNNVVINYKTMKLNEQYFANVTVDIDISYPNMQVDFSGTNRLNDFREYALIADDCIRVNGKAANVTASIFAGDDILVNADLTGQGELNVTGKTGLDGVLTNANIVAGDSIIITGSSLNTAKFTAQKSDIWCRNFILARSEEVLGNDVTKGALVTINSDCNSYVADDLTVSGKNSVINIGGSYYGYGYDGTDNSLNHAASSAIIINGGGSTVNLGSETLTLKKLIIGGHSYINYKATGVDNFMTGESLSFKANQELYLIPSKYLGVGRKKAVGNPMPTEVWEDLLSEAVSDADVKVVDLTGFFAYNSTDGGLLNKDTPYEIRKVNDLVYVYFKFKDKKSAAEYMDGIIAGKDKDLQAKLSKYTSELFSDGIATGAVNISSGGQIYAPGTLIKTNGSTASSVGAGSAGVNGGDYEYSDAGTTITPDVFVLTSIDLKNRFSIISHLFVSLPFEKNGKPYIVNDIDSALYEMKDGYELLGNELNQNATENIVDYSMVTTYGYNDDTETKLLEGTSYDLLNVTKVAIDGNYKVPNSVNGGIIIATGDVTVNNDFTGLIIAKGNIRIGENVNITTDVDMIEMLLTFEYNYRDGAVDEEVPFRDYFYAYKRTAGEDDNSESVKIESLDYDDIVSLDNWRKYDDSGSAE